MNEKRNKMSIIKTGSIFQKEDKRRRIVDNVLLEADHVGRKYLDDKDEVTGTTQMHTNNLQNHRLHTEYAR